ncbi:MAG TPA: acyl-CoA dehydrogenase family protein [Steroidobacter sp.]
MSELTRMLVDAAERIFRAASPVLEGTYDVTTWQLLEHAGIDRLLLPEELGGVGDDFEAVIQVARCFGMHSCFIPLIETLVANRWLREAGLEVGPGPKTIALPLGSRAVTWAADNIAVVCGDGSTLSVGEACTGAIRSNLAGEPVRYLTPERAQRCNSTARPGAVALYLTLKSAAIVGTLQTALDMTVRYVNERTQFGRRIGSFQAIQHMLARMAEETAAATAAVQLAGRRLGTPNELYFAAVAKSRVAEAATSVAAMAHQCHGAIGYTREHPLHRFTNRALAWRDDGGSEDYWNEQIGRAALGTPDRLWDFVLNGAPIEYAAQG